MTRRLTQAATALGLAVALALGAATLAPPAALPAAQAADNHWCGHSGYHAWSDGSLRSFRQYFNSHTSYYSGSVLVHRHTTTVVVNGTSTYTKYVYC